MSRKCRELPIQNDVPYYHTGDLIRITRVKEGKYQLGDGCKLSENVRAITPFGNEVQVIVRGLQGRIWKHTKIAYYFLRSDWLQTTTLDITQPSKEKARSS